MWLMSHDCKIQCAIKSGWPQSHYDKEVCSQCKNRAAAAQLVPAPSPTPLSFGSSESLGGSDATAPAVTERGFLSISVAGLLLLLESLCGTSWFISQRCTMENINSNSIREYLLAGFPHPAQLFPHCFSQAPPVAAITYEWRLSLKDVFSFLNPFSIDRLGKGVPCAQSQLLVWFDVLFINQLSSDVASCLHVSKTVYQSAPFHLTLATATVATRAWCLFEHAVRRSASKETLLVNSINRAREDLNIRNFLSSSNGRLFEGMKSSKDQDLVFIRQEVLRAYSTADHFNEQMLSVFLAAWS